MKRKRGIASFFSPKRIESEAEQQGSDKVNDQGHEDVEGDEEQQQESVSDEIEGKDEQGQEEEGEHNREEETEEGEHHIDKVQEGDKTACRAQTVRGKGIFLSPCNQRPVELVHMV